MLHVKKVESPVKSEKEQTETATTWECTRVYSGVALEGLNEECA